MYQGFNMKPEPQKSDYVLATKYSDGDPRDQWCVGFYAGSYEKDSGSIRYLVVNDKGEQFRSNGFRRVKKISAEKGKFLVDNAKDIEASGRSVWWWLRAKIA